jgi:hypothetical protein
LGIITRRALRIRSMLRATCEDRHRLRV